MKRKSYRELIRDEVLPFYNLNDPAHQIDHADTVCDEALRINKEFDLGLDEDVIVAAAYCHDVMAQEREHHHLKGWQYVIGKDDGKSMALMPFSSGTLHEIGVAVLQHRASWEGPRSSLLAELLSTADIGSPKSLDSIMRRSYDHGKHHFNLSDEKAKERAVQHVKEKNGRDGYMNRSPLYYRVYEKEMEGYFDTIDKLSVRTYDWSRIGLGDLAGGGIRKGELFIHAAKTRKDKSTGSWKFAMADLK